VPRTQDGRLVVDGTVSAETTLYDFEATFKVTYEMGLDDIPRDPKEDESRPAGLETIETLEQALSEAGDKKRAGELSDQDYEAAVERISERFNEFPRTVGVRPAQNPPEPEVTPDFSLTVAGKVAAAAGAAATVGLLALPVTWVGAAGVGAAGAGGLLTVAIVQYLTTVLTIDWFGAGIGSRQVKQSLNDRPEGTSLPPIGIPVDVDLNRQRLAVYFRSLPAKLWVSCVAAEAAEDQEGDHNGVRLVGGQWPTDGHPWKLSNDDAMLFVESGELQLLVEPDDDGGQELSIGVATTADGRRHLRVDGKETEALHELPQCSATADRNEE
jgi:hypothetical protein